MKQALRWVIFLALFLLGGSAAAEEFQGVLSIERMGTCPEPVIMAFIETDDGQSLEIDLEESDHLSLQAHEGSTLRVDLQPSDYNEAIWVIQSYELLN